ncbi:AAA family ATPase [Chromobacterium haemolyticum]|uniref:AAA family ATPase n=1 Tax=Chromobacterium haemolyticum TaxID=394935 RepID=A0ABS3GQI3_9NEIS|nr:ATP-binding protein [Chromobacterium haemolyticum]MBK0416120.1 AAA family ATPase [Chromobacterium haemolyticum]MBO0417316.1 AAA family ATPase [Chromobacterium haemolyticum]MBO0500549.1 AAA family ATPase [Chromobacterium haemolyticum]
MTDQKSQNNRRDLNRAVNALLSEVRAKSQRTTNSASTSAAQQATSVLPERVAELVFDMPTRRRLSDLILTRPVKIEVEEFLHEFANAALLRTHSVEPRHTILLVGAPGNGKTSLAEAIATELGLPLLTVRYDAIVDSFLGETSNRLRRIIDHAAVHPSVLFFDEFDAVGKERGDTQETGEIKRVVSSLLVQMDRLPSHSVIICATNHPELLDRAVWRRFEVKLEIPMPGATELKAWFKRFQKALGASVEITAEEFAQCMAGESMSEVEAFTLDVRRKLVLSKGALTASDALKAVLEKWQSRLRKQKQTVEYATTLSADAPAPRKRSTRKNPKLKETPLPPKDLLSDTEE